MCNKHSISKEKTIQQFNQRMKYFLVIGEASGDLHASNLMLELKFQDTKADFCYFGGDLMQAQGGKLMKHYREMAFMGFFTVLANIKPLLKNLKDCKKAIVDFEPDVVILVDYPGFNLQMAKFVKQKINIPVFYYISPKIWAWKESRVKQIKKYVDKMYTILPFETEFYNKHHFEVQYVGNPIIDSISSRPNQTQTFEEFAKLNNLSPKPIVALLAGSRKQEIASCLPKMIETATSFTDFQVIVAGAPGIDKSFYIPFIANKSLPIIFNQTYDLLAQAQAAVVNSGTATLETSIIGTPQVVVYNVALGRIAMIIKKIAIKVKYISLVNLIAEKEVVKELIAHYFNVENLKKELASLLFDEDYRKEIKANYQKIAQKLGEPGTAKRAAEKMIHDLNMIKYKK